MQFVEEFIPDVLKISFLIYIATFCVSLLQDKFAPEKFVILLKKKSVAELFGCCRHGHTYSVLFLFIHSCFYRFSGCRNSAWDFYGFFNQFTINKRNCFGYTYSSPKTRDISDNGIPPFGKHYFHTRRMAVRSF